MTDTQPTKFCVGCKWCGGGMSGYPCFNGKQSAENVSLVTGRTTLVFGYAREVRPNMCKGEWWEEKPKPEEPLTFVTVPLTAKRITIKPRPSIFQRIANKAKEWFG